MLEEESAIVRDEEARPEGVSDDRIKIVRASSRLAIDLRRKADAPDKAWADAMHQELLHARRRCVNASNALARALYRIDADAFDALAEKPPRQSRDWPSPKVNAYAIVRAAEPELNPGIASSVARAVLGKWSDDRWDIFVRQNRSPNHYRIDGSFPMRAQEVKFLRRADGGFDVSFCLTAGKSVRKLLPLELKDEYQENILQQIHQGRWKHGNVLVEQDRQRPRKWYLRIAYTRFVPKVKGTLSVGINRGIRCFLAASTGAGDAWVYDGRDIEATLRQFERRRREYQYDSKASGRWGHGRERTIQPIERLSEKGRRWRQTRCQVIARRFVDWCIARGVVRIHMEDFSGIRDGSPDRLKDPRVWQRIQSWPYHELGMRIRACAEEAGMEVGTEMPHGITRTCPFCGHESEANVDREKWVLRCTKCKRVKHLDVAAAMNVRARGEARIEGRRPAV